MNEAIKVYTSEVSSYEEIKVVIDEAVAQQIPNWLLGILDMEKVKARYGVSYVTINREGASIIVAVKPFRVIVYDHDYDTYRYRYSSSATLPKWICEILREDAKDVLCIDSEKRKKKEEEEI